HPFWTLRGLSYYPMSWIDCQMGLVLGSLTISGLGLYLALARRRVDPGARGLLEAWLLGGLVLITVVGKKQPFYSIPLLAPAALLAAAGWISFLRRPATRGLLLAALLGLGGYQLGWLTFGSSHVPAPGKWSYLAGRTPFVAGWLDETPYTQAAPPKDQGLWLDYAASVCREQQSVFEAAGFERPYVFLFSDSDQAPEGQVMPRLRLAMNSRLVEGFTMSGEAVVDQASQAGCLVFITASGQRWPTFELVEARWQQWGAGSPGEDFRGMLLDLAARAGPAQVWQSSWEESVHVYTLAPGPSSVPN
ncbi:MAG: hypothetical protein VX498_01360, partial [Myxococcota bacterium]|nr:hypothetical protein [Myxococcota bacterium]